jgi:excisionase family DNA binding protein
MRLELQPALELARELPAAELPHLIGELAEIRAVALSRLAAPAAQASTDRLLDVAEVASVLHVSEDYLYRHSRRLPFARRIGRRLLFSASALDNYLRKQK